MNLAAVHELLAHNELFNQEAEDLHRVRWIKDGHTLSLDAEPYDGGGVRECLNCHKRRAHLTLDYICLKCRIEAGHAVPWDEISAEAKVTCPYRRMLSDQFATFIAKGQDDPLWVPPICGPGACLVDVEMSCAGATSTVGHPLQRLDFVSLELPLFTPIPIQYVAEVTYWPGEYGGDGETDVDFGWVPVPEDSNQLNLADSNQGR